MSLKGVNQCYLLFFFFFFFFLEVISQHYLNFPFFDRKTTLPMILQKNLHQSENENKKIIYRSISLSIIYWCEHAMDYIILINIMDLI